MQTLDLIIIFGYLIGIIVPLLWYAGWGTSIDGLFLDRVIRLEAFLVIVILIVCTSGCLSRSAISDKHMVETPMKEISYRGGLVKFSVPSHWKEEYGEQDGGIFYEEGVNTGTLRLTLLTFAESNSNSRFDVNAEARDNSAKNGGESFDLRDGRAMARYDSQSVEDGESISQRFWCVYSLAGDSHVRIAVFSYTLPSTRFNDDKHVQEMEMLDREIRNARFAEEVGTFQ